VENREVLVKIKNLRKDYLLPRRKVIQKANYVHAVQGINVELKKGLIYGIVGESGCGKTTLAKMLVGIENITSGKIYFKENELNKKRKGLYLSSKIQMVLQNASTALPPGKTVKEILSEPLEIHKIKNKNEKIDKILEDVHLDSSILDSSHEELSAGIKQKVNIARALILDTELIVSDESISSLDPISQVEIMNLFLELNKKKNLTIIFIAHDISTIKYLCDMVLVMYLGVCVELAPNEKIFSSPVHPYTKALMDAVPTIEKGLSDDKLYVLQGEVPSPTVLLKGCNFTGRCNHSKKDDLCYSTKPELDKIAEDHFVACFKK
jgi:oligopeptide/dipeptide ABC transporter ATP-binding protein